MYMFTMFFFFSEPKLTYTIEYSRYYILGITKIKHNPHPQRSHSQRYTLYSYMYNTKHRDTTQQ